MDLDWHEIFQEDTRREKRERSERGTVIIRQRRAAVRSDEIVAPRSGEIFYSLGSELGFCPWDWRIKGSPK